ncbi:hypothetical protein F4808DRAFT_299763 [Astrocystis sublimbata]|nr:hypothetical protein F4808DRAFT_299763 [Astrocystis sublimbata]
MSFFTKSRRKTWQRTGWVNVVLVIFLEIVLIAVLATSLARTGSSFVSSTIIYEGPCAKTKFLNTTLHLAINLISSGIAASSNYFMQVLCSPTREEIDKAHKSFRALDIGIPSLHNLKHVSRFKWISWLILIASSIPIHLFFNSSVFETNYQGSDWQLTIGTEQLVHGGPVILPGASLAPAGAWGPLCELSDSQTAYYCRYLNDQNTSWTADEIRGYGAPTRLEEYWNSSSTLRTKLDLAIASGHNWTRLSEDKCKTEYMKGNPRENFGNVIFIVAAANSSKCDWTRSELFDSTLFTNLSHFWDPLVPPDASNSLWYSTGCSTKRLWYEAKEDEDWSYDSNCDDLLGKSQWSSGIFSYPVLSYAKGETPQTLDFRHQFPGLDLRYCLAQPLDRQCKIGLVNPILATVILCGIIKLVVCSNALIRLDGRSLVTPGDTIESFITHPDECTIGLGTLDIVDLRNLARHEVTQGERSLLRTLPSPRLWTHTSRRRLLSAMTMAYWFFAHLLFFVALGALSIVLAISYHSNGNSFYTPGGAFGPAGRNLVASIGQPGYIGLLLIANTPQLLLSLIYFQYNAICTRLCSEAEWNSYGSIYTPLRVSQPVGQQTSTYRLQMPYRYGIPLIVASALLHWLLSNAIFTFITEGGYWKGVGGPLLGVASQLGLSDEDTIVALGYSPTAMLALLISALVFIPLPALVSFRKLKNAMVLGGSNSLIISATCHCYAASDCSSSCSDGLASASNQARDCPDPEHCTSNADIREDGNPSMETSLLADVSGISHSMLLAKSRSKIMWGAAPTSSKYQEMLRKDPPREGAGSDIFHLGFGCIHDDRHRPVDDVLYT